jgi:hypothetical protein
MTLRRLEILQWGGLLTGALVWAATHVVGYGITEAECNRASAHWNIGNDAWQGSLTAASAVLVLCAELAAVAVFRGTRHSSYDAEPPPSRIRFFAIAAITANAIFLAIVLLDGAASIFNVTCRQG